MDSKLIKIDGGGKPNQLKEDLVGLKENLSTLLEFHQISAKIVRTRYLALREEGFDEKEALELCKGVF